MSSRSGMFKTRLEEQLQASKRWASAGSGAGADVAPLIPGMEHKWKMGGLNISFHRADITVSVCTQHPNKNRTQIECLNILIRDYLNMK